MILLKLKDKKIFSFFNIVLSLFLISFISIILYSFSSTKSFNKYNDYSIMFTHYYPGDATGSGGTTGSGKKTSDFTADENGWYYYNSNGTDYLVVAAATVLCRDASNHCGIDIAKHGIATTIRYYNYYDTMVLNIGGKNYNAMVLDSCGACMWGKQDQLGEKIDIFTTGKGSVNPGIYNSTSSIVSTNGSTGGVNIGTYTTTYSGNVTDGYIYKTQQNRALFPYLETGLEIIEKHVDNIINKIFNGANYTDDTYTGGEGTIGIVNSDSLTWKQYDLNWSNIKLGNSSYTIKSAGCLATSIAIQIKVSGTKVTTDNFNPGTFVQSVSKYSGFTSGGLFKWGNAWQSIAPNWNYGGKELLPASKTGKIAHIKSLLDQGYYPVMCVKKNCGHWVAVTGVTDDNITIADPGSSSTTVWPKYDNIANDTTLKVAKFKKND